MALVEIVDGIIKQKLDRVAREIEAELKEACPKQTGDTAKTIHIVNEGEYTRFIGSDDPRMYYANYGSGATSKFIAFVPNGGLNRAKRKYAKDATVFSHGRKGWYDPSRQGFVQRVANRHR